MGLGSTAKKLQKVTNAAEELYAKMNEVIGKVQELETEVQQTSQQVDSIEDDLEEQRALVKAVAEAQDVDVDSVLAEAAADESDGNDGEEADPSQQATIRPSADAGKSSSGDS